MVGAFTATCVPHHRRPPICSSLPEPSPPPPSRGRRRREPLLSPYLGQTAPGGQQICLWGPGEQQPLGRGPSMHCSGRAGGLVQVRWASATLPGTSEPSPRAARAPARSRRSPAPSAPLGWLTTPPRRRLPDPPSSSSGHPSIHGPPPTRGHKLLCPVPHPPRLPGRVYAQSGSPATRPRCRSSGPGSFSSSRFSRGTSSESLPCPPCA